MESRNFTQINRDGALLQETQITEGILKENAKICINKAPFFDLYGSTKYRLKLHAVSKALHLVVKVHHRGPGKKEQPRKKNLGLVCLCGRHHGLRCQQVASTLQGTESPGGCCAATPTKKNEVFDLQVKKIKK